MVRIINIPGDKIEVHADKLEVHANIGPGRVVSATFEIEDSIDAPATDPGKMPFEEWERNFNEIINLAPLNQYPCDDSREAMYGPDPGEDAPA